MNNGGFARDALIAALVVSVVVHIALMFWARPMIMTEVLPSSLRSFAREPMRVTKAEKLPDPIKMDAVADVKADKEAPEVTEAVASLPAAETSSPVAKTPQIDVPPPEMPDVISRSLPQASSLPLPDPSHTARAIVSDVPKMETTPIAPSSSQVAPSPAVTGVSLPSAPVFESPNFSSSAVVAPQITKLEKKNELSNEESEDEKFKPSEEVMSEVNENIVEQEKQAVRALVDSDNAKEMSSVVSASMKVLKEGDFVYFNVIINPVSSLRTVPKDFVVLIDASGSIGRDRMKSIRRAAKRILRSAANTGDRFNLVAFRDRYSYAFRKWMECDQPSFTAADRWLDSLAAHGRTDVFATISSVLTLPRDPKRPLIALVVTDGDANHGVSGTEAILSKFSALNDGLVSVYMYGVKESSNRRLIDILTRSNRGESFIFEGSRFEAGSGIDALSERFRDPLLSDLRIVFSSATEAETYPRLLRNLYRGCPVYVYGRAPKGTKEISFSLKGLSAEQAYESFFTFSVENAQVDDALPYLWRQEKSIGNIQRQK